MDSCQSQWKQFQVTSFLFDWIHFHSLYLETIAVSRYLSLLVYKFLPFKGINFLHSHPTVETPATLPALCPSPSPPASLLTQPPAGVWGYVSPQPPALEGCVAVLRSRRQMATLPSHIWEGGGVVERWAFRVKNTLYYFSKIGNLDTPNIYVCLYYFMFFSYSYIIYRDISFKSICFALAVRIRLYSSNTDMVGFIRNFLSSFSIFLG